MSDNSDEERKHEKRREATTRITQDREKSEQTQDAAIDKRKSMFLFTEGIQEFNRSVSEQSFKNINHEFRCCFTHVHKIKMKFGKN